MPQLDHTVKMRQLDHTVSRKKTLRDTFFTRSCKKHCKNDCKKPPARNEQKAEWSADIEKIDEF
jgi:hypothetical protein